MICQIVLERLYGQASSNLESNGNSPTSADPGHTLKWSTYFRIPCQRYDVTGIPSGKVEGLGVSSSSFAEFVQVQAADGN